MGDIAVLVLVHQHVAEALVVLPQHVGLLPEQSDVLEQQVAEIGGVEGLQPLLIGGIELAAAPVGEALLVGGLEILWGQAAVLPAVHHPGEDAGRPALLVDVVRLKQLLDQAHLVVHVEDGEVGPQSDQFGMPAKDAGAD